MNELSLLLYVKNNGGKGHSFSDAVTAAADLRGNRRRLNPSHANRLAA